MRVAFVLLVSNFEVNASGYDVLFLTFDLVGKRQNSVAEKIKKLYLLQDKKITAKDLNTGIESYCKISLEIIDGHADSESFKTYQLRLRFLR